MKVDVNKIKYYEIGNSLVKARVMNYGCTLLNLWVTVGSDVRDVVLGYENIEDYFDNPPCFGSCVLPNANRIEGAKFTLNEETYTLDKNDGDNNLHSGFEPLHKRLWDVSSISDNSVCFTIESKDMDCKFPGNRKYTINYTIENNKLSIEYTCISDKDTLFNPTNHSYFNLLGHDKGEMLNHKLIINGGAFTPSDEHAICHGELLDVAGTPMDFTKAIRIGERIDEAYDQLKWGNGYDHNYVVDTGTGTMSTLSAPDNSLTLNIYSTAPCLQLYTGNYLSNQDIGKGNHRYSPRCGVALETQYAPNAINVDGFEKPILRKGEKGYSKTVYEFEY